MWACALWRRPWGRISTLFAVILKRVLSRNFDQSMLKNEYFWGKTVKISSASRADILNSVIFVEGGARTFLAPGRKVP